MQNLSRFLACAFLLIAALPAYAATEIDNKMVADFLNERRGAYLAGDPGELIKDASPDITVTMISSVVEGPAGTRVMRLPQYVPFLKESFANTEYYGYNFQGVKAQFADDKQSAKIFVDVEEDARVQGLPVKAKKAVIIVVVLKDGDLKVDSLTEKIENVTAGVQFSKSPAAAAAPIGQESSSGAGQTSVKIGQ